MLFIPCFLIFLYFFHLAERLLDENIVFSCLLLIFGSIILFVIPIDYIKTGIIVFLFGYLEYKKKEYELTIDFISKLSIIGFILIYFESNQKKIKTEKLDDEDFEKIKQNLIYQHISKNIIVNKNISNIKDKNKKN